jgi:predicted acyl esterase
MTCRDGTRLISRIWQPEGEGPWPVLLMRQPYGRAIASTPTLAHPAWYASHGFLVVVQDVRGQGDSEGRFAGFSQEGPDTADTLGWVRQLPGSNGRVGTYGFSYQAFTQLVSGPEEAELPDCLVVAMAGLDERLHWASSGGAHWWSLGMAWGLQLAALACRRRGDRDGWAAIRRSLAAGTFLEEGPGLLARHDPEGMAWRWLQRDPAAAEGWTVHRSHPSLWTRPLLLLGGWHDPHLEGVLDLWQQSRAAGGAPLLRIGAWSHLDWGQGVDALQLAFLRRNLQGAESATESATKTATESTAESQPELLAPIAVEDGRSGQWITWAGVGQGRNSEAAAGGKPLLSWTLEGNALATAGDGGRLDAVPGADEGIGTPDAAAAGSSVWLVHDPWRPVPGRGGHLGLDPGWCVRGDLDRRRDVACFTSQPLAEELVMLTRPRLQLRVAADQPGFDLCAALSVLAADGQVTQLATGVARHRGEGCLLPIPRELTLQPLLLHLHPGERLRLSLAAAAWPQIAVNPGCGAQAWGNSGPDHRVITLTLELAGSRLRLEPLLDACPPGDLPANCGDPFSPP